MSSSYLNLMDVSGSCIAYERCNGYYTFSGIRIKHFDYNKTLTVTSFLDDTFTYKRRFGSYSMLVQFIEKNYKNIGQCYCVSLPFVSESLDCYFLFYFELKEF